MKPGDKGYIIENNKSLLAAEIKAVQGNMLLLLLDNGKATRLRRERFFETKEKAEKNMPYKRKGFRSPYDF